MDAEEEAVAGRVERILHHRNMTQDQLATSLEIGQPAVSMLLSRKARPRRRTVERVAGKDAPARWEWRMIWAEAAEMLGKPRPVPTLYEVKAEPDRAMAALRRMDAAGFLGLETLRAGPDLAPVRERPDFRLLILDLAFPARPFAP